MQNIVVVILCDFVTVSAFGGLLERIKIILKNDGDNVLDKNLWERIITGFNLSKRIDIRINLYLLNF